MIFFLSALFCNSLEADDCLDAKWGVVPEFHNTQGIVITPDYFGTNNKTIKEILKAIPADVEVYIFGGDGSHKNLHPNTIVFEDNLNSTWARDYMPQLVRQEDGSLELVQFRFNNTAGLSTMKEFTDKIAATKKAGSDLARHLGVEYRFVDLAIDGGAYFVDNGGRLFVSSFMKSKTYNPNFSLKEIETILKESLKVKSVHWFDGLPNEVTRHLDMYVKPVGNNTIMVASSGDPSRKVFLDNVAKKMKEDFEFKVIRVANAPYDKNLVQSYTNSLVVNGKVIVPSYQPQVTKTRSQSTGRMEANPVSKEDMAVFEAANQLAFEAYVEAGFLPENIAFADSSQSIVNAGAVHCLVCQIGKIETDSESKVKQ